MERYELYRKNRNLPLKIALLYIWVTLFLSILGPVVYPPGRYRYLLVILFISGVSVCLYMGYYLGLRTKDKYPVAQYQYSIEFREQKWLKYAIIISFASIALEVLQALLTGHFTLALSGLGSVYSDRIEDHSNFVFIFRFLFSAFRTIAISYGMYKFKQLNRSLKIITVFNIFLYLFLFIFCYGTQKGVSDVVIFFSIAFFLNRLKAGRRMTTKARCYIIVLMIGVFLLFSYMQYLRYAPREINATNYHLFSTGDYRFNPDHIVFKLLGNELGFGAASILNGYLSQGYYGLSLCLQLPFEWTYGIGNSYALIKLLSKFGINGIYEQTYLARMQATFGRNGLTSWNTIFPWLASDFTWIGAIFFFVIVGYFLAKTWKEVLLYDNMFSYLLFGIVMIQILFIPANNQIFHGYDSFISTWVILLCWIFIRRKYSHE